MLFRSTMQGLVWSPHGFVQYHYIILPSVELRIWRGVTEIKILYILQDVARESANKDLGRKIMLIGVGVGIDIILASAEQQGSSH